MNEKAKINWTNSISLCLTALLAILNVSVYAADYKVHFRAVSFLMACDQNAPTISKSTLHRKSNRASIINGGLCVNAKKSVVNIRPSGISVKYDDTFDVFQVVIHLNKNDALAIKKITSDVKEGHSRRMFITADGSLVVDGYLNEPFDGNDYYVAADNHDAAFDLAKKFVDKIEKRNK